MGCDGMEDLQQGIAADKSSATQKEDMKTFR